jgi:hypothetical protein
MSRDASARGRAYRFGDHGNSQYGAREGNYVIKNNQAEIASLAYGDGVTTVRIFPTPNLDNPNEWEPYRIASDTQRASDPNQFGDWIRRYPAVRSTGDPRVTFISYDPADPQHPDPQTLPAQLLYNAVNRAIKAHHERPGWAALLQGGQGRGAQLPRPTEIYLVQCMIVQHKRDAYSPPKGLAAEHKLVVLEMSQSAGMALMAELNKVNPAYQGEEGNWEQQMVNGDPIALTGGRYVTFYKKKDGDPRQQQQLQQQGWNMNAAGAGQRSTEKEGYGCYLEPTWNGRPAALVGPGFDLTPYVRGKVRAWNDILNFPTVEEQAHFLADKFPADLILYAWQDHPEWIPDAVRQRAVAMVSAPAPAMPPMPGYPTPASPIGYGMPPAVPGGMTPPGGGMLPPGATPFNPYAGAQLPAAPQQPAPASDPAMLAWGMTPNPAAGATGPAAQYTPQPAAPAPQMPFLPPGPATDPALPAAGGMPAGIPQGAVPSPMPHWPTPATPAPAATAPAVPQVPLTPPAIPAPAVLPQVPAHPGLAGQPPAGFAQPQQPQQPQQAPQGRDAAALDFMRNIMNGQQPPR